MPIVASDSGGGNFTPAPEGTHQAVCIDVVDLGLLKVTYDGNTKETHKIDIFWEIGEQRDDGKPFYVRKRFTLSLGDKATLRKDLESWRGKAFTIDELRGFDVEKLIGANALVNVVHATRENKTYANIASITPLMKGMSKMPPTPGYIRVKDRPVEGDSATTNMPPHPPITDDDLPF